MPKKRTTEPRFDPDSFNAQFATIIAKLDGFGNDLSEIKAQTTKTNGRVLALESWRDTSKAKMAGISLAIGAVGGVLVWLAEIALK